MNKIKWNMYITESQSLSSRRCTRTEYKKGSKSITMKTLLEKPKKLKLMPNYTSGLSHIKNRINMFCLLPQKVEKFNFIQQFVNRCFHIINILLLCSF